LRSRRNGIACSFRAVTENGLLRGVAVSKKLRKIVGIIGASANIWVVLINVGLDGTLLSELSSSIVKCSKNVPSINETWSEHASKSIDSHHLWGWMTWSHSHYNKLDDELGIWWDFSKESLPSCIIHCHSFSSAWGNDFLSAVERDVVHFILFFNIIL